ncbi:MAG: transporter substrate-binding domain-containing protein [Pseudomonadota bacterium]
MRSAAWSILGAVAAFGLAALGSAPSASTAHAQECGTDYTIQPGDSLARIARRVYGSSTQWTVIFYANQDRLGSGNSLLVPGQPIRLPCVGENASLPQAATAAAPTPSARERRTSGLRSRAVRTIQFLTADDYKPFTDRTLENGGLLTEILVKAMATRNAATGSELKYNVSWVNDWSAHLQPLLTTKAFDMGFPWFQPPCREYAQLDEASQFRCRRFFFSDPLFEVPTLFFSRIEGNFTFSSDTDVYGKTICRPAGYYLFIFDQGGRNWLKDNRVTLLTPRSVEECFRLVDQKVADAVAINEFTGRSALASLGWTNRMKVLEQPVSIDTLHLVVTKTHPNARTLLFFANDAIRKLRENGDYDEIVERHLTRYWDSIAEQERIAFEESAATANAAAAVAPAATGAQAGTSAGADESDAGTSTN